MRMPWGKFRDEALEDVPASYLCWCIESAENLRPALRDAIETELGRRFCKRSHGSSARPGPTMMPPATGVVAELIEAGFRALAKKHHPDVGGTHQGMLQVGQARDYLMQRASRGR